MKCNENNAILFQTALLPAKDEYQVTRAQLQAQLDVMMGGRVAEELILGEERVTTGAADDMRRASELAAQMVRRFGMSDRVGLRDYTVESESSSALVHVNELSNQTTDLIDQEINRLLKEAYTRAKKILTEKAVSGIVVKVLFVPFFALMSVFRRSTT